MEIKLNYGQIIHCRRVKGAVYCGKLPLNYLSQLCKVNDSRWETKNHTYALSNGYCYQIKIYVKISNTVTFQYFEYHETIVKAKARIKELWKSN